MSPNATPVTQSAAAPRATNGDQARHQIQPSAIKWHAYDAKRRSMSPSATPATQNLGRCRPLKTMVVTPATQSAAVPRTWGVQWGAPDGDKQEPYTKMRGKTQWIAAFLPLRAPANLSADSFSSLIFFLSSLLFSSLLFSSLTLPTSAFSICPYCGKFDF